MIRHHDKGHLKKKGFNLDLEFQRVRVHNDGAIAEGSQLKPQAGGIESLEIVGDFWSLKACPSDIPPLTVETTEMPQEIINVVGNVKYGVCSLNILIIGFVCLFFGQLNTS